MDKQHQSLDQLPKAIQHLCMESLTARKSSYSPYSKFKVGAALLLEDGSVITGCNVENASYGLAICAERTACVKAVSQGQQDMKAIAIAADLDEEFVGPCGACRQFMCEFNPDLEIYLVRLDHKVQLVNLNQLLPDCFSPKKMAFGFHNGN
ncbi:hypothetical protein TCAL_03799 [Tigriopus californicus]|uniref:Cytidine deaminase n=1 Tax=Tigriopus californicus TaxID=6832 RepID=A0A553NTA9_TIGCA|nr:cytidine deaminase-like [Tigriopus californicus]TRY68667.1 hypothetical protein TCAL_03799 [Tigriopus californicus]|eukprot:TCALIF_03799-PA protein Name:"Similar to Cda Cytidine deaminase (Mus musculus)" AED:0.03 eAED:0.04 QI:0/0/0/1/1/1/2/0/150